MHDRKHPLLISLQRYINIFARKVFRSKLKMLMTLMILIGFTYLIRTRILPDPQYIICPCDKREKIKSTIMKNINSKFASRDDRRQLVSRVQKNYPSLALNFLLDNELKGSRCSSTPNLFDIQHRNLIWQEAFVYSNTYQLFSAHLDTRNKEGQSVRILAMINSATPSYPTCHFYFPDDHTELPTVATKAISVDLLHWQGPINEEWNPFIITCGIDEWEKMPEVVSLADQSCSKGITNALRIHQESPPSKKGLVLCTKFLYDATKDLSDRLIEWFEASKVYGVDLVEIYAIELHPNVSMVLNYYEKDGFVKVNPWTNPGTQPNIPYLYEMFYESERYSQFSDENILYTDCLLRHINTHRYVGVWNIVEFIIPVGQDSIVDIIDGSYALWKEANEGNPYPPTSYLMRTAYFFDDFGEIYSTSDIQEYQKKHNHPSNIFVNKTEEIHPSTFHLLTHIERSVKFTLPRVHTKSIHDTKRALGIQANWACLNIEGKVDRQKDFYNTYPLNEAYVGYYSYKCQEEDQSDCDLNFRPYVMTDRTLWKRGLSIFQSSLLSRKKIFEK